MNIMLILLGAFTYLQIFDRVIFKVIIVLTQWISNMEINPILYQFLILWIDCYVHTLKPNIEFEINDYSMCIIKLYFYCIEVFKVLIDSRSFIFNRVSETNKILKPSNILTGKSSKCWVCSFCQHFQGYYCQ